MERKTVIPELKSVRGREVHAVIARLDVPDADRDTLRKGFFDYKPMEALVVPAHQWSHYSLGKSETYEQGSEIHSILTWNGTTDAANWFESILFDYEHGKSPLVRYSWGFRPHPDAFTFTKGGRDLHARRDGSPGIQLYEISPVLMAASVGTRTTMIKSRSHHIADTSMFSHIEARLRQRRALWQQWPRR
jgi:hypothetical protein